VASVVDCHQGWCGPCKAITTTLRKIFFEFGERPLKMYTANVDEVKHLEKYRGSCQPVFLFYMVRCSLRDHPVPRSRHRAEEPGHNSKRALRFQA
jgi:hypothetical protein